MTDDKLIEEALKVRERSYSPYSNFPVGAALHFGEDSIAVGTNVENCSYGLTVCAERHAIAAAVVDGCKPGDLHTIAIAADAPVNLSPCGACRQVLAEFANPDSRMIIFYTETKKREVVLLSDLLPKAFNASSLAVGG